MITVSNVSVQFGKRVLFNDVNLKFTSGNCYGIIGANGAGKSTFLRTIYGDLDPTTGSIALGPGERLSVLSQDHFKWDAFTVMDTVMMGHTVLWDIMKQREELYAKEDFTDEDGLKVSELEERFAELDGWNAESDAAMLLSGLGIKEDKHYTLMGELSGKEKVRVMLAQALYGNPDNLLLDEPTNDLDMETVTWLEEYLSNFEHTVLVVSHDRHFLNMVCTHMADLDYGELRVYPGNYDEYMTAATQARERLMSDNAKKKAQISELQSFVSRFSANASKSKQATSRARQIDKIKLDEVKASSRQNPFIRFEQDKKLFRNALEIDGLSKGFDNGPLFKNLRMLLEVGDKLAVLGTNGVGKTTLLKTLVGELEPDSGFAKWSENANIGYYAQDHESEFAEDLTLFDWMSQWKQPSDDEQVVRGYLGRLLFSQDDIKKSVKVLSGGEKGRMLFGKLMMQRPNILVMDEPTNHMDMESIEALNMALEMYEGTLVFVSHDREFVSSLATRILEITPTKTIDFSGNYEDYLRSQGAE